MPYRKRTQIKPGARFRVGDAWDGIDLPYVMPGAEVEAIGLPGQVVFVHGRGYEVEHGKVALRVVSGELADRPELRGREAVGFCFQQNVTANEQQLLPLTDSARQIVELVLKAVRGE